MGAAVGAFGRFCFFDVMTTDVPAATAFYVGLLGYTAGPWTDGGQPGTLLAAAADRVGRVVGLGDLPPPVRSTPRWCGYVLVPDVEVVAERAHRRGGDVLLPPTRLGAAGAWVVVRDPQGALVAAYASAQDPPEDREPRPGELSWSELVTTDATAALSFHGALFGWSKTTAAELGTGPGGAYQHFGCRGRDVGGVTVRPAHSPGPPAWLHYVRVDDVDATVAKALGLGAERLGGPLDLPNGDRIAQLRDPLGACFGLHGIRPR